MALTYSKVDYMGKAAEPILGELIFQNKTVAENYVNFQDDIKSETIFTDVAVDAVMQAYVSGAPSAAGSTDVFDVAITPVKITFYDEFNNETLRSSRFKRDMAPGAWNMLSTEFEQVVIGQLYASDISSKTEKAFWNGVTMATKAAIAALTAATGQTSVSTQEKALVASKTAGLVDGVVTKMIYNNANATLTPGVGGRVKVVGTTLTSSNIKEEVAKGYAALPAVALEGVITEPYIYLPKAAKQLINIYNNNPSNYKDAFAVEGGQYSYNDLQIKFVPFDYDNVMILASPENIFWCTDLTSDISELKVDKIANNREDYFIKAIMTLAAHVGRQSMNVLYVG